MLKLSESGIGVKGGFIKGRKRRDREFPRGRVEVAWGVR